MCVSVCINGVCVSCVCVCVCVCVFSITLTDNGGDIHTPALSVTQPLTDTDAKHRARQSVTH